MVITFPRALPDVRYVACDFTLDDGVTASASKGRLSSYTNWQDPLWGVSMTTDGLLSSDFAAVEAWWLSLRGGTASKGVLFRNPHICYPIAHLTNKAPADDEGTLSSVTEGNVLNIAGVAAGLVLSDRDYIGLEYQGRYYLGRITEVSGDGDTRSIRVEPPPYEAVAQAGAVVRFANIPLLMRPVPGSFSKPRAGRFYTVSFQLQEAG